MFSFNLPTTKRIGIDLGTPYSAYLLAWFTSMPRKGAGTGQAAKDNYV